MPPSFVDSVHSGKGKTGLSRFIGGRSKKASRGSERESDADSVTSSILYQGGGSPSPSSTPTREPSISSFSVRKSLSSMSLKGNSVDLSPSLPPPMPVPAPVLPQIANSAALTSSLRADDFNVNDFLFLGSAVDVEYIEPPAASFAPPAPRSAPAPPPARPPPVTTRAPVVAPPQRAPPPPSPLAAIPSGLAAYTSRAEPSPTESTFSQASSRSAAAPSLRAPVATTMLPARLQTTSIPPVKPTLAKALPIHEPVVQPKPTSKPVFSPAAAAPVQPFARRPSRDDTMAGVIPAAPSSGSRRPSREEPAPVGVQQAQPFGRRPSREDMMAGVIPSLPFGRRPSREDMDVGYLRRGSTESNRSGGDNPLLQKGRRESWVSTEVFLSKPGNGRRMSIASSVNTPDSGSIQSPSASTFETTGTTNATAASSISPTPSAVQRKPSLPSIVSNVFPRPPPRKGSRSSMQTDMTSSPKSIVSSVFPGPPQSPSPAAAATAAAPLSPPPAARPEPPATPEVEALAAPPPAPVVARTPVPSSPLAAQLPDPPLSASSATLSIPRSASSLQNIAEDDGSPEQSFSTWASGSTIQRVNSTGSRELTPNSSKRFSVDSANSSFSTRMRGPSGGSTGRRKGGLGYVVEGKPLELLTKHEALGEVSKLLRDLEKDKVAEKRSSTLSARRSSTQLYNSAGPGSATGSWAGASTSSLRAASPLGDPPQQHIPLESPVMTEEDREAFNSSPTQQRWLRELKLPTTSVMNRSSSQEGFRTAPSTPVPSETGTLASRSDSGVSREALQVDPSVQVLANQLREALLHGEPSPDDVDSPLAGDYFAAVTEAVKQGDPEEYPEFRTSPMPLPVSTSGTSLATTRASPLAPAVEPQAEEEEGQHTATIASSARFSPTDSESPVLVFAPTSAASPIPVHKPKPGIKSIEEIMREHGGKVQETMDSVTRRKKAEAVKNTGNRTPAQEMAAAIRQQALADAALGSGSGSGSSSVRKRFDSTNSGTSSGSTLSFDEEIRHAFAAGAGAGGGAESERRIAELVNGNGLPRPLVGRYHANSDQGLGIDMTKYSGGYAR